MDATTARRFYQDYVDTIYHEGKVEKLGRFYAADIVPHPAIPGVEPGLQGLKVAVASWLQAFTSMCFTVDSFVFQNNIMAPRITISAVHSGDYMGIPATGRKVQIIAHPHYRLEHHKIVEYWDLPDMLTLLQQLGVMPAPTLMAWYPNNRLGVAAGRWEPSLNLVAGLDLRRDSARV